MRAIQEVKLKRFIYPNEHWKILVTYVNEHDVIFYRLATFYNWHHVLFSLAHIEGALFNDKLFPLVESGEI